jgi:hypothetical protein
MRIHAFATAAGKRDLQSVSISYMCGKEEDIVVLHLNEVKHIVVLHLNEVKHSNKKVCIFIRIHCLVLFDTEGGEVPDLVARFVPPSE